MIQKVKVVLWIVGFVLLMIIAVFSYDLLSKKTQPDNGIGLAENEGDLSNTDQEMQKAPDFIMNDMNGRSVKLSEMQDKPVVLNFWASWCPPCQSEMPEFEKVYQELSSEIQFMMVDLTDGNRETKEKGANYIKEQGYTFPVYFDLNQEGAIAYKIRSIPTTFFINKDGNIVTWVQGAIDEKALREGIDMMQ